MRGPIFDLKPEEFIGIFNTFTTGFITATNRIEYPRYYKAPDTEDKQAAVEYFVYNDEYRKSIKEIAQFTVNGVEFVILYNTYVDPMGGFGYTQQPKLCKCDDGITDDVWMSIPLRVRESSPDEQDRIFTAAMERLYKIYLNPSYYPSENDANYVFLSLVYRILGHLTGFVNGNFQESIGRIGRMDLNKNIKENLVSLYNRLNAEFVDDHSLRSYGKETYFGNEIIKPCFVEELARGITASM